MKKIILLLLFVTLGWQQADAQTFGYNGLTFTVINPGEAALVGIDVYNYSYFYGTQLDIPQQVVYQYQVETSYEYWDDVMEYWATVYYSYPVEEYYTVTSIGDWALSNTYFQTLVIPNTINSIGYAAFYNSINLTQLNLPESVTTIADSAFKQCTALTSVYIPYSVTNIADNAFYGCSNLTSVTCNLTNPLSINASVFQGVNQGACSLTVPNSSVDAYRGAAVWQNFSPVLCANPTVNTTIASSCGGSYTWANNGQTYYESGTYTGSTTNCVTEKLNLTIKPVPAAPTVASSSTTSDIAVSMTGPCSVRNGMYNYIGMVNGKNNYLFNYGGFDHNIQYDGVKWVLTTYGYIIFENTTVLPGLFPPTTGWSAVACGSGDLTYSIINPTQTFCPDATIANLNATGNALKWYDVASGGTALAASTTLVSGDYYVSQTIGGCESARTLLTVIITPITPAPTASAQTFCSGAKVENLLATGSGIKWYSASESGWALSASTALATGTYYVSQTAGICESARTAVNVTIKPATAAPTLANTPTNADIAVSITEGCNWNSGVYRYIGMLNGKNNYEFTTDPTMKLGYVDNKWSQYSISQYYLNYGWIYYYHYYINTNVSPSLVPPTVGWSAVECAGNLTVSFINPPQTFCAGATIAKLDAIGEDLKWYDAATGGSLLASTTVLSTGNYYVSQTIEGCESARALVPVIVNPLTTPTFTTVASICSGAPLADLPTTSNEGITGTWSPAMNNLETTNYTFTPDAGQCALSAAMTVTIYPTLSATINGDLSFCNGNTTTLTATSNATAPVMGNTDFLVAEGATVGLVSSCSCPPGYVAVGYTGRIGGFIDQMQLACKKLNTDGTLGTDVVYSSPNGLSNGGDMVGPYFLPGNDIMVGISAGQAYGFFTKLEAKGQSYEYILANGQNNTTPSVANAFVAGFPKNNVGSLTVPDGMVVTGMKCYNSNPFTSSISLEYTSLTNFQNQTTYTWSNGATTPSISVNSADTYSVMLNNLGGCSATASVTTNTVPVPTITFTQINPVCVGATLADLPATSNEGITGTWLPAMNNLETTNYTFTPDIVQCGATASMKIVVNPLSLPTFTVVDSICLGAPLADLPTTSNEGITGTWSPAMNNLETTTYTFTPDAGQCASAATLTIAVSVTASPTVASTSTPDIDVSITGACSGFNGLYTYIGLLNGKNNYLCTVNNYLKLGYDGVKWVLYGEDNVSLTAFESTTVLPGLFPPTTGWSATGCPSGDLTYSIINDVDSQTFCAGAFISDLDATGDNLKWYDVASEGTTLDASTLLVSGNYYVSQTINGCESARTPLLVIITPVSDNITTVTACGSYTWNGTVYTEPGIYTGTTANCITEKLDLTITPVQTPRFNLRTSICSGETFADLPTTSIEGITGTWSPALNNLATTTYTFTPDAGQCANTTLMTIYVSPVVTPIFTQVLPICEGVSLSPLPTVSNNGIGGTWSPALNNLATTTYTFTPYEKNPCALSTTMTIVVRAAGTISGGNVTVCSPGTALNSNGISTVFTNSTTLTLSGNSAGSSIQWQRSMNFVNATNATPAWSTVASSTGAIVTNGNTLTVLDLSITTWYRAKVTNGSCVTFTEPARITVNPFARAGIVTSSSSVCSGGSIMFTSAAYTGNSIAWEVSTTSASAGFSTVAGENGLTFTLNNAPSTTFYVRTVVTSADCTIARSAVKTITVNPMSVAGTITGGGTVCSGSNKSLKIAGCVGRIQWMYSTDGTNFMNVPLGSAVAPTFSTASTSSSASSYSVNNITGTTFFKAVIKSGLCSSAETNVVQYTLATSAAAGTATAAMSAVCPGAGTTIGLVDFAGDITWQKATNTTAVNPIWTNISGAVGATLATGNLTVKTKYRAIVTIGNCASIASSNVVLVSINCATGAKQIAAPSEIDEPFSVVAYPNPSNNVFNFKVNGANDSEVSMLVFDMMGRQIENKEVKANDIENISFGQNYSSGVYNVIVSQGMNTITLRLVKK